MKWKISIAAHAFLLFIAFACGMGKSLTKRPERSELRKMWEWCKGSYKIKKDETLDMSLESRRGKLCNYTCAKPSRNCKEYKVIIKDAKADHEFFEKGNFRVLPFDIAL